METRMLYENEVPQAAKTARGIFDHCMREQIKDAQVVRLTEQYLEPENLIVMMRKAELFLWGTFENGELIAVGGLQQEGHITMLYVYPYFQRLGIARFIVGKMKEYAKNRLNRDRITVNAMPVQAAAYFERLGFKRLKDNVDADAPYVTLWSYTTEETVYPVKSIPERTVIKIVCGFLAAIFFVAVVFILTYF